MVAWSDTAKYQDCEMIIERHTNWASRPGSWARCYDSVDFTDLPGEIDARRYRRQGVT